jgi:hypothetical protein
MRRFLPDVNTLLALAASHGASLATFDRRIPAIAVAGGKDALEVIFRSGCRRCVKQGEHHADPIRKTS